jgi:hypothetical protein
MVSLILLLLLLRCCCHRLLQPGIARPEIIAEVASSLADMLYASDKLVDAKGALQVSRKAQLQHSMIAYSIIAYSKAALQHDCFQPLLKLTRV